MCRLPLQEQMQVIKLIDLTQLWIGVYGAVVTVPETLPLRNISELRQN